MQYLNNFGKGKNMRKQSQFSKNFAYHYREYVEFLNDLVIKAPITQALIVFPNVSMIFNLMMNLHEQSGFIDKIAILQIKQHVFRFMEMTTSMKYIITLILFVILLSPLFVIINLVWDTYKQRNQKKVLGKYKVKIQNSFFQKIYRTIIVLFQYTFFPILLQISMKNITSQIGLISTTSLFILILTPFTYFIGEYHCLQINSIDQKSSKEAILERIKFPNNIIDNILAYSYIIAINKTEGLFCLIIGIVIYCLRIIVAIYFPCYPEDLQKYQIYVQISCTIFLMGLMFGYLSENILIIIGITTVVLLLIWRVRKNLVNTIFKVQKQNLESKQITISSLKKNLFVDQLFAYTFRELIFLERKQNGHRVNLMISILKEKCYLQQLQARGGVKIVNCEDLMTFQMQIVQFFKNLLIIADKSVSIFKLLQSKEPKVQIFVVETSSLIKTINSNKAIIEKMFDVNNNSSEAMELLHLLFKFIYNDHQFTKYVEQKVQEQVRSALQRFAIKKLFSKNTSVVFINIFDDIGKITKASKNLQKILGYSPHNLIGLSINQIIPYTIKPFHEGHLMKFVHGYSKKTRKADAKIQFYAYSKDSHLVNIIVSYFFVMTKFNNFELGGMFRRIDSKEEVILTDYYGNLEGWTQKIGQIFSLDQISMSECRLYNIFPLFPSLIKYASKEGVCLETIFFKSSRLNHQYLIIMDFKKSVQNQQEIWQKQMNIFERMILNEEIVDIYYVKLQLQTLRFCSGNAIMRKFSIHQILRVQNFYLINKIIKKKFLKGQVQETFTQKKYLEQEIPSNEQEDFDEKEEILKESFDTNFTLDIKNKNFLQYQTLKKIKINTAGNPSMSNTTMSSKKLSQCQEQQQWEQQEANLLTTENNGHYTIFEPKLIKNTNHTFIMYIFTIMFLICLIYDQVMIIKTQQIVKEQSINVINRNRGMMIFAKSLFNPNITYIKQFDNAKMLEQSDWLSNQSFNFQKYLGNNIQISKFYLFNVQIPSILDKVVLSNTTTKSQYKMEIQKNFKNIIKSYDQRITRQSFIWSDNIQSVRNNFIIRVIILSLGSIIYSLLFLNLSRQFKLERKKIQSLFKFQKTDLQQRISHINQKMYETQIIANKWYLEKQFYEIVKNNQISNIKLKGYQNNYEERIKFDTTQQRERSLWKNNIYFILTFFVLFLISQITFIITYTIINTSVISQYQKTNNDLDNACKLIVLPNLQIASLFQTLPQGLIQKYSSIVTEVLQKPTSSISDLFLLLQQAPCINCPFLYPILATNFRSYYSNFNQIILEKKKTSNLDVEQLYLSLDVVIERIMTVLVTKKVANAVPIILIYFFSLAVFFIFVYYGYSKIDQQNQKLELFLKYFNEDILTKNKHINSLLSKNI